MSGVKRIHHDLLDSTNSEARRMALAGEPGPVWITAAHQSAGRGRRGNVWNSGDGNLAATLLLRPEAQASALGQLSFVAALAVADMATHFAPHAAIAVKWPNDVLADGSKLAGILLETESGWLAVGIGANLVTFPQDTAFPATSLAQLGIAPPSSDQALDILAARFDHWYAAWMDEGFQTVRAAWLARARGLGLPIRAQLPNQTLAGVFEGIDAAGALLLNAQGRIHTIAAGEVFF